ncbi:MAG: hypothetical protein ACRDN0_12875 [Trebonia sp.]
MTATASGSCGRSASWPGWNSPAPRPSTTQAPSEEALAELRTVRPLLAEAFGPDSAQVRNLDKQAERLRTA